MEIPQKLEIEQAYDPVIPLLGIYLKELSEDTIKTLTHPCLF
jgi:hypothetical protein